MSTKHFRFGRFADAPAAWTRASIGDLCREAEGRRTATARYPLAKTWSLLERLQRYWADPNGPRRQRLLAALPGELGFSREMVALGLERLHLILDPRVLATKVETELKGIPRTGGVRFDVDTQTAMYWRPLGVLLHVLAGNGFLGGVSSLLEGLLTGNVSVLKTSSDRTTFLFELLESLCELDTDGVVTGSIATVAYPSSSTEVIDELKQRVDGIVVWGGEAAVKAYRDGVPARTRVVVFGPKLSLGLVTAQGLAEKGVAATARALADELAIWDQTACTAPQICYVEGETNARALGQELAAALATAQTRLPCGEIERDAAVEIRKARGLAILDEAKGTGFLHEAAHGLDWTVFATRRLTPEPSPLHRTLRLAIYDDLTPVLAELAAMRGYLQTVGLTAGRVEAARVADQLAEAGALRMLDLGRMSWGLVDDPHDGAYDLPQLLYLVFNRLALPSAAHTWIDVVSPEERAAIVDERLQELGLAAGRHPHLATALGGRTLRGAADLATLPILTRAATAAFAKGPVTGGYVARSGGTTGAPRYSVYDGDDWEALVARSVDVLYAVGLKSGDRVANCLTAGDLYGSFVSFDHINVRAGATSFAFATTSTPAAFVEAWRAYRINVVEAMPSFIIPFLKEALLLEPNLSVETFIYGGMPLAATDERWLREALGVTRIGAVFGANDGGPIGYQCTALRGRLYHTLDDYNLVEIVDDAGSAVPAGTAGRILITSLRKFASPLLRYEIGDLGRIVPGACDCGRSSRRLELLGRIEDGVRHRGGTFSWTEVAEAVDELGVAQVQIELSNAGIRLNLEIDLKAPARPSDEELRARACRAMTAILAHGGCLGETPVTAALFDLGGIPRRPGSAKIAGIIDHRQEVS